MIRDPDVLLAVVAQLKQQFGAQLVELHDALAVAHVRIAMLEKALSNGAQDDKSADLE